MVTEQPFADSNPYQPPGSTAIEKKRPSELEEEFKKTVTNIITSLLVGAGVTFGLWALALPYMFVARFVSWEHPERFDMAILALLLMSAPMLLGLLAGLWWWRRKSKPDEKPSPASPPPYTKKYKPLG